MCLQQTIYTSFGAHAGSQRKLNVMNSQGQIMSKARFINVQENKNIAEVFESTKTHSKKFHSKIS